MISEGSTTPQGEPPEFDFIIVGAGAAGCVLANRLTADHTTKVLLLEAGEDMPPGSEHPAIRDPYPISLSYPQFSWPGLVAEVGADLGNNAPRQSRPFLQGRGVGGGSNIYGMIAFRGFPEDFDSWKDAGATGWAWNDVVPYFRRLENDLDFDGTLHGKDGPIPIRRTKPEHWAPFSRAFAEVVQQRGYLPIADFNADFGAGVGSLPMANLPTQRVSAAMGYLDPAVRRRTNLRIAAGAHVDRVLIEKHKVLGVRARTADEQKTFTGREVILAAGGIFSPAILMRSGVGPGAHLADHGVEVHCNLSGVGQRLMNHPQIQLASYLPRPAAQLAAQRAFGQSCLRYSSGYADCGENDMLLVSLNKTAWHPLGRRIGALGVTVRKSYSRGMVRLRSADPAVTPDVKFNMFSDDRDLARLILGLKLSLDVLAHPRMAAVHREVFLPNPKIVQALSQRNLGTWLAASVISAIFEAAPIRRWVLSAAELDPNALANDPAALRRLVLERAHLSHHVSCTCRMGRKEDDAVVDSDGRVFGVEGLRVADASIMPVLVGANPFLTVLMMGEKLADHIKTASSRVVRAAQ